MRVSVKTIENSEQLCWQSRLGFEPDTSRLPVWAHNRSATDGARYFEEARDMQTFISSESYRKSLSEVDVEFFNV